VSDEPYKISASRLQTFLDCPKKFKYGYVDHAPRKTGKATLMGNAIHKIFLEEYLVGGIQDIDFLMELTIEEFRKMLDTKDPRDYRSGLPLTEMDKFEAIEECKIWGRELFEAWAKGEDSYGNPVSLPEVSATEKEYTVDLELPNGQTVTLFGYVDIEFADGSIGDLKTATDNWQHRWSLGKAIGELQPVIYGKMTGASRMRYVIVDKKTRKSGGNIIPITPTVRTIEFDIGKNDIKRLIEQIEYFLINTDAMNGYKNGVFPTNHKYGGDLKNAKDNPEINFCGKLCDHKERCFRENFARD
jgi:hypothetical protein